MALEWHRREADKQHAHLRELLKRHLQSKMVSKEREDLAHSQESKNGQFQNYALVSESSRALAEPKHPKNVSESVKVNLRAFWLDTISAASNLRSRVSASSPDGEQLARSGGKTKDQEKMLYNRSSKNRISRVRRHENQQASSSECSEDAHKEHNSLLSPSLGKRHVQKYSPSCIKRDHMDDKALVSSHDVFELFRPRPAQAALVSRSSSEVPSCANCRLQHPHDHKPPPKQPSSSRTKRALNIRKERLHVSKEKINSANNPKIQKEIFVSGDFLRGNGPGISSNSAPLDSSGKTHCRRTVTDMFPVVYNHAMNFHSHQKENLKERIIELKSLLADASRILESIFVGFYENMAQTLRAKPKLMQSLSKTTLVRSLELLSTCQQMVSNARLALIDY